MQPLPSSSERSFNHPLYPYRWNVAKNVTANPNSDTALCTLNTIRAERIIENTLRTRLSCIEAVCKVAQSLNVIETQVVFRSEGLHTSIVLMPQGDQKYVFVRRKDGAALFKKKIEGEKKVSKAFLFVFGEDNHLIDVQGAVRFAFNIPTEFQTEVVSRSQRQLSIMQMTEARPDLFPRNYVYIQYKPNRILVFQERALHDLWYQHKVQSIYTMNERFVMARQLWEAVRFLHANHIVHRDLKLENILYLPGRVKVTDFDLSCHDEDVEDCKNRAGTPGWAAPELNLKGDEPVSYKPADTYSLGHLFYLIVNPGPAFHDGTAPCTQPPAAIRNMNDAAKAMLQRDPKKRPLLEELPLTIFDPTAQSSISTTSVVSVPPAPVESEEVAANITPRAEERPVVVASAPLSSDRKSQQNQSSGGSYGGCDFCCNVL